MTQIAHYALQAMGWLAGLLLIYAGMFLYEDGQKHIQNRLEELWIRIDDRSKGAESVFKSLTIETSRIVERVFDRIFGKSIWSCHFLAVSLGLTSLSAGAIAVYYFYLNKSEGSAAGVAEAVVALSIPGLIPAVSKHWIAVWIGRLYVACWIICAAVGIGVVIMSYVHGQPEAWEIGATVAGITVGMFLVILTDVVWLYVTRLLLRKSADGSATSLIIIWTAVTALLGSPVVGIKPVLLSHGQLLYASLPYSPAMLTTVIAMLLATRAFLVLVSSIWLLVVLAALIHRCTWTVLARILYPLQRFQLISKPKSLVSSGVALIGVSSGAIKWFEFATKFGAG
jgi:hypothetical protein